MQRKSKDMRKGDKIFAVISVVIISLYVFNGIVYPFYKSDTVLFFGGLVLYLGIPWIIYRSVLYYKERKLKI